ncbi:MAG TPA: hypothetical protein VET48_02470, partial [Steroidobacteraceae bacterium]|nr:hypothetical protein [Steroidobacteraceae bacterium]
MGFTNWPSTFTCPVSIHSFMRVREKSGSKWARAWSKRWPAKSAGTVSCSDIACDKRLLDGDFRHLNKTGCQTGHFDPLYCPTFVGSQMNSPLKVMSNNKYKIVRALIVCLLLAATALTGACSTSKSKKKGMTADKLYETAKK